MRRLLFLFAVLAGFAANAQTLQESYIEKYSRIAVDEMMRSGVPASITLAQGILESGSGQSVLAVKGNNHFGIKCHKGWTGRSMLKDDDERNECFRVYDSPEESFRDHSDFLRYRDRYKFLFDLERTDYKGWAYGLKQAGYATDPKYPAKLIKYIEDYDLTRFDEVSEVEEAELPVPPHVLEEPELVQAPSSFNDSFTFSLSRKEFSLNGVPFVYAREGETYRSIAKIYNKFRWELLKYNEVEKDHKLKAGTVVFLEPKKNKTQKGLDMYIVEKDGEDFMAICQRFAVKSASIMKLNGYMQQPFLREGDEIKLR